MGALHGVVNKVTEVATLAESIASQAAAKVVSSAAKRSDGQWEQEMNRRLDGALRALRGEELLFQSAVVPAIKPALELAREMADSYSYNASTGVSKFIIPAGVADVDAMTALNTYYGDYLHGFRRKAIEVAHLDWFRNLPEAFPEYCQPRDYSRAREVILQGVVVGTRGETRSNQEIVLQGRNLAFSDPRDQALAAALHACRLNGADLFQDSWVRGVVPGIALRHNPRFGVFVHAYDDQLNAHAVVASGSPRAV